MVARHNNSTSAALSFFVCAVLLVGAVAVLVDAAAACFRGCTERPAREPRGRPGLRETGGIARAAWSLAHPAAAGPPSALPVSPTKTLLITTRLAGSYQLGVAKPWDAGLASERGDAGEMTMRQMQSVDHSDRLTAILIMINVAALVLLAFVL